MGILLKLNKEESQSVVLGKLATKYLNIINKGIWTEQDIINFRMVINKSRSSSSVTENEIVYLLGEFRTRMPEGGYKLTPEQCLKGIEWFYRSQLKKNGEPRKNCPLGFRELNIVRNYYDFTFTDLVNNGGWLRDLYLPEYTMVSRDGNSFSYYVDTDLTVIVTG